MRIFISGGCKNGKSLQAQALAVRQRRSDRPLYYVATMCPADQEDDARIARHLEERAGWGFETIELPRGIAALSQLVHPEGSFLLDSLTALLANEMFSSSGVDASAPARVLTELAQLLDQLPHIVIVSDSIGMDAARYDPLTEQYRKGLAQLDRLCATRCDVVVEMCAGGCLLHKGESLLEKELLQ